MNKDFRADKVVGTYILEVKQSKKGKIVNKTIGEMIHEIYPLPEVLFFYQGFPFLSLDENIETEFVVYRTKNSKRKFKITPLIVKIEEIEVPK
jgi:hypothetical protein